MAYKYIFDQTNKQDDAYTYIAQKIESGEYPQGMLLVERQISEEIGISRTPVRAALSQLASEGELVVYTPHVGMSVRVMTAQDITEIYDVRIMLEATATKAFIENASQVHMAQANELTHQICEAGLAGKVETASRLMGHYHQYLLDHCANSRMNKILTNLLPHIRQLRLELLKQQTPEEIRADMIDFHTAYNEAIQQKDIRKANKLLVEHYELMKDKQIARLEKERQR